MRYLLFISEAFVLAHAVGRSGFSKGIVFKNDQQGRELFTEYLDERASALFSGVLDSTDEDRLQENLPKLGSKDTRRAVSNIVDTRCAGAVLWKYDIRPAVTGRRDGLRLRLTTVSDQSSCAHWLAILEEKGVLMSDLCLLSDLCSAIRPADGSVLSVLVLTITSGDYRIIGFRDRQPVITRSLSDSSDSMQALIAEITKTAKYLNKGDAPRPSDGVVLYAGDATSLQRKELVSSGIVVATPYQVTPASVQRSRDSQGGVAMLLQLMLARNVRHEHRLSGGYRAAFKTRRWSHSFIAGIFCCVMVTAASGVAGARMLKTLDRLNDEISYMSVELDERLAEVQPASFNDEKVDAMRSSLSIGNRITQLLGHTPMDLLVTLATELSRSPVVHVVAVNWQVKKPLSAVRVSDHAEYEAVVSGYVERANHEVSVMARGFNGFVSGLQRSGKVDFVEVLVSPLAFENGRPSTLADDPSMPFTIRIGVQESEREPAQD